MKFYVKLIKLTPSWNSECVVFARQRIITGTDANKLFKKMAEKFVNGTRLGICKRFKR